MNDNVKKTMCDLEAIIATLPPALQQRIPASFMSYMQENKMEGYVPDADAIAAMRHDLLSPTTTDYVALISLAWFVDSDEERYEMAKAMRVNDGPGALTDEQWQQILAATKSFMSQFE